MVARRALALATVSLAVLSASCGEGEQLEQDADPRVDALFSEFMEPGSPGAVVMVIREGKVLHSRGYGLADLDRGTPLTPSTPVRLGSMTKAFAAMAIVLLEERGDLSYDDPVVRWVPELAPFDGITLRHLLNHTSGLPDYYEDSPLEELATAPGRELYFANAEAIAIYESWGEPLFGPGERYEYSNPGYEVLGLVTERVTGMRWGEFLAENLFAPLEMSTTVVRDQPDDVVPGAAIGYAPDSASGDWIEDDAHWLNWMVGAGGIYSSLEDLYRWDQALWGWAASGDRLDQVFEPARLNDGASSPYGFGWRVSDQLGREAIHHGGSWVGFRTAISRFVGEELTVIVLTNNSGAAAALRDAVAALYLTQ
jgi:CubicO group peptidase (beta-lactamase class C family)